jgi:hypothetical protein
MIAFFPSEMLEVHDLTLHGCFSGDGLDRRAIWRGKCSLQYRMAFMDLLNGLLEGGAIQRPIQTQGGGNVVGGTVRFKLLEKPQALLSKRERRRPLMRTGGNLWRVIEGLESALHAFAKESLLRR